MTETEEATVLLGNYRVLDLTDEKGLLCGKLLGDLGADVIKVERPGGDPARRIGPFYHDIPDPEKSLFWFAFNANKRGITLNIETKPGQELFRKLVRTADFVVESFSPGYLDKLGLGYSALSKLKPSLIMTSITPFGQKGPYANFKGSNLIAEAMGGLMFISGSPEKGPLMSSCQYAYNHAGLQAAVASLTAHFHRHKTGTGDHIDLSIQQAVLGTVFYPQHLWFDREIIQGRYGTKLLREGSNLGELIFACKDGHIMWRLITGNLARFVVALVEWMDEQGMAGDLRGIDWQTVDMSKATQEQQTKWEQAFGKFFLTRTMDELYTGAIKRGIMLFPVNDVDDILKDPQLAYRNFWSDVEHPELSNTLRYHGVPYRVRGIEFSTRRAPLVGEHNEDIYSGVLGLTGQEMLSLKTSGTI